jgi:hypothetical protein
MKSMVGQRHAMLAVLADDDKLRGNVGESPWINCLAVSLLPNAAIDPVPQILPAFICAALNSASDIRPS